MCILKYIDMYNNKPFTFYSPNKKSLLIKINFL